MSMTAIASSWERSAPSLQLASVVAEFAENLRDSYWAKEGSLVAVMEQSLKMELASVPGRKGRVAELLQMVRSANELRAQIDSHNVEIEELERQKRVLEERGSSTEAEDLEELRQMREQLRRDLESTRPVDRD